LLVLPVAARAPSTYSELVSWAPDGTDVTTTWCQAPLFSAVGETSSFDVLVAPM
jgi:hypothetical protein